MTNFEKPLHEFSEKELQDKVDQWDPRFGTLALLELQRRTAVRMEESSELYARSSGKLARTAISVSLILGVVQLVFSSY